MEKGQFEKAELGEAVQATTEEKREDTIYELRIPFNLTKLTKELYKNFPEYGCYCFQCTSFDYEKFEFKFVDVEENKGYAINIRTAEEGVKKLLEAVSQEKLFFDVSAQDLLDAGCWDAYILDAALQMSIFDKVVYG